MVEPVGDGTRERLFRLAKTDEDVAEAHPEALERLRGLTQDRVRQVLASEVDEQQLGAEERRQLRAFGYLDE